MPNHSEDPVLISSQHHTDQFGVAKTRGRGSDTHIRGTVPLSPKSGGTGTPRTASVNYAYGLDDQTIKSSSITRRNCFRTLHSFSRLKLSVSNCCCMAVDVEKDNDLPDYRLTANQFLSNQLR